MLSHESWYCGRDSNCTPPEYESDEQKNGPNSSLTFFVEEGRKKYTEEEQLIDIPSKYLSRTNCMNVLHPFLVNYNGVRF
jgi:hypothetical protein